jgi:hypothetical protein
MFIDELRLEVLDTYYDEKTKKQSKDTKIISAMKITEGILPKQMSRLLEDLTDYVEFRGGHVVINITIDKSKER